MSPIFCKEVTWEEVNIFAALQTGANFDPEKIFHLSI